MRFAPYLIGLGLAGLTPFACSSPTGTTTAVARPQLVAVDPNDFMGNVVCEPPPDLDAGAAGADGGVDVPRNPFAAHSYVATLFDVTPDATAGAGGGGNPQIPLPSSPPTTCAQPATFAFVVAGHRYIAEVDAYHEEPGELFPISPGSRLMNLADGTRALPGWNTVVCGGYPPSPEAGVDSGGSGGTGGGAPSGAASGIGGSVGGRPPGVISYASITQTPHECGMGLQEP